MKFTVDVTGGGAFKEGLKGLEEELVDSAFLERVAEEARQLILRRTAEGRDLRGRRFPGYTREWKRHKTREGRYSGAVDLRYTGAMLSSITTGTDAEAGIATLSFKDAGEAVKALVHNSRGMGRKRVKREFFGLTASEKDELLQLARAHVRAKVEEAGGS